MATQHTVLVTGATGRLGRAVCEALLERGHGVRATDQRYRKDFPTHVEVGDLRDEFFVHRAVEGCDSVVHLGNHPNAFAGPTPQRLLADNVAMNANVITASVEHGVGAIAFASSIQVMIKGHGGHLAPPYSIPYLPMDGDAPTNPGTNTYALSKEVGERLLEVHGQANPDLSLTAFRFPMLPMEGYVKRLTSGKAFNLDWLNFGDGLAYLLMPDAGSVVTAAIERRLPGFRRYFPALSFQIDGMPLARIIRERYGGIPLRKPADEIDALIDVSRIETDLGWKPEHQITIKVAD